jgi:RNA polymerase sigma-70 factor (ECF subfamily)
MTAEELAIGSPAGRRAEARGGATLAEIESVYAADAPKLRRIAAGIVGDFEAGQDVVQEAFALAIRKRRSFLRRGSIEGWIWRVVVNTALNRRRSDASQSILFRRAAGESAAPRAIEERADNLRAAVSNLPERQRAALFLCYYADLDYAAIGRLLGIRSGTVGKLLHDARTAIREEVQP